MHVNVLAEPSIKHRRRKAPSSSVLAKFYTTDRRRTDMKIKVLIKKPDCNPEIVEIENELRALQKIVCGHIESIYIPNLTNGDIVCYGNEEGKLIGLEPNFPLADFSIGIYDMVVGPVVFVGSTDEGEDRSLSEEEIDKIKRYFS